MIYFGTHYGWSWFIPRKGLKGFYIRRTDAHPEPYWEIDRRAEMESDFLESGEWFKANRREIRMLIKYLFKYPVEE